MAAGGSGAGGASATRGAVPRAMLLRGASPVDPETPPAAQVVSFEEAHNEFPGSGRALCFGGGDEHAFPGPARPSPKEAGDGSGGGLAGAAWWGLKEALLHWLGSCSPLGAAATSAGDTGTGCRSEYTLVATLADPYRTPTPPGNGETS